MTTKAKGIMNHEVILKTQVFFIGYEGEKAQIPKRDLF